MSNRIFSIMVNNPKVHPFLMDYAHSQRIKVWGDARVIEGAVHLVAKLMPPDYKAKPEQVALISVSAWDVNCPKHIPVKLDADKVKHAMEARNARIRELELEIARLRSG